MQLKMRNDDPVSVGEAASRVWRWRKVAIWLIIFWVWLKAVEFYLLVKRVPTFVESGHDGEVEDQQSPSPATK